MSKTEVYVELVGAVSAILKREQNNVIFTVYTSNMQKYFQCQCRYFCPLREGDIVKGICQVDNDVLRFVYPPFVEIPNDRETIMGNMIEALKGTRFAKGKAEKFYDLIARRANNNNVERYISESAILWMKFKDDDLLEEYTERSIIKKDQVSKFLNWWFKNRILRRLYLLGLTNREIKNSHIPLLQLYDQCLKNPYFISSLSLDKCSQISLRLNHKPTDDQLQGALVIRTIQDFMENKSWTGVPSRVLQSLYPELPKIMPYLKEEYEVKAELFTIYLNRAHTIESHIASLFESLLSQKPLKEITPVYLSGRLSEDQQGAIYGALNNQISIISGPAGSGKTTIISEIVHNLEKNGISYMVVSFTGKAVSRIREVIKRRSASTMHRLIARNTMIPKFQHLIIDEASMVSLELMYDFVTTFTDPYKITFVGDINQLEPISWGGLLDQLLKTKRVPTYFLTKVHRTINTSENGILINATRIIEYAIETDSNSLPPFEFEVTSNFQTMEGTISDIMSLITLLIQKYGIKSEDLTIITPYNRDLTILNQQYQQIVNKGNKSVTDSRGTCWMVNDRICLKENRYDINVMNGEEGIITDVGDKSITVKFKDGSVHDFNLEADTTQSKSSEFFNDEEAMSTKELTVLSLCHSFAISVHRSQGSEWDYVIFYIPENLQNSRFLNRRLVYTALTRAKQAIWCIGNMISLNLAATRSQAYRCDNLAVRITHENEQINLLTSKLSL